jgi:hypothetical protein
MQKGPKPAELQLSEEERKELEMMVRRHSTPQQRLLQSNGQTFQVDLSRKSFDRLTIG